ncbi:MAG: fatty acid desaturase [Bacteroidia bacterium]
MNKQTGFHQSFGPEPHRSRTKEIIAQHPEVRNLIGRNPFTIIALLGMTAGITFISYLVKDSAWWVILLVSYLVGAFFNHALFVMIHECCHNLLFKRKWMNTVAGIIANLPHVLPSSVMFSRYHLKHHSFQGIHELDGDIPDFWEARMINNSFFGKALWLLLYPVFQSVRIFRLKEIKPVDGWLVLNWVMQIVYDVAIVYFFGWGAFAFLTLSFFFSVGLHPLGARWVQEHYLTLDENQETYSYYGPLNTLAFNVGYHNEHHDFPSIPWNKLPLLKKTASSYYDSLHSHNSWFKLFFRFLFDKNISLFSRTTRMDRGKVALTDVSKPDEEIFAEQVA